MSSNDQAPKKYLLVVEDDRDTARGLQVLLELWGFEVVLAYDGETALAAVSVRCPDAVLVDLSLPKLDGLQVARKIREHLAAASVRLLALTGYDDPHHRLLSRDAGFDDHLVKPIDPATLRSRLYFPAITVEPPANRPSG